MFKEKSIVINSIFNLIRTFFGVSFPVITFTYSARILGVDGVGQVNFVKSIITCFTVFALLGMNHYGTREVAKLREDPDELSKYVHEMLLINGVTTALAYVLLFLSILIVPKLQSYKTLLLINSLAIVLQGMGMEWLYQGLEEYRYIAVRSVLFQVGALVAMFIFVRDAGDVVLYAAIILVASSGSYVLNFVNARKYIHLQWYKNYEVKKHLRPLLWLFAMTVSVELYTVLDSTMLGFLQGDAAVGRYTAAVKVNKLANTLITSVGVVLIPRLSFYIGQGKWKKVKELVGKTFNYVFMLSVPAAIGLFVLNDEIILLFSGSAFSSAAFTMRLLTPIVLIIPLSVVTNSQVFIPMGKEKLILRSTMSGAFTNFICNLLLIPRFAENGAAIATVAAETVVTIVSLMCAREFFDMRQIFRKYFQYWLAAIPIPLIVMLAKMLPVHYVLRMFAVIALSAGCYFLLLFVLKNDYLLEALQVVRNKLMRKQGSEPS